MDEAATQRVALAMISACLRRTPYPRFSIEDWNMEQRHDEYTPGQPVAAVTVPKIVALGSDTMAGLGATCQLFFQNQTWLGRCTIYPLDDSDQSWAFSCRKTERGVDVLRWEIVLRRQMANKLVVQALQSLGARGPVVKTTLRQHGYEPTPKGLGIYLDDVFQPRFEIEHLHGRWTVYRSGGTMEHPIQVQVDTLPTGVVEFLDSFPLQA